MKRLCLRALTLEFKKKIYYCNQLEQSEHEVYIICTSNSDKTYLKKFKWKELKWDLCQQSKIQPLNSGNIQYHHLQKYLLGWTIFKNLISFLSISKILCFSIKIAMYLSKLSYNKIVFILSSTFWNPNHSSLLHKSKERRQVSNKAQHI